ncbi:AraC family transcriptional regulator [Litoribacillus peritrichatus]|uniref:AraC family transcriptional regulator n=2 Tax=Litoribacillus peritrichatus TaxID=718191 RepID=A0ABP7N2A6_9GAMM
MDAFSELIRVFRLKVTIYHNAKVCGDWLIREHSQSNTCFHMATLGACELEVPGHLSCILNAGDLVIFPRELPHKMVPVGQQVGPQQHKKYSAPGSGVGMLCGQVMFEHSGSQKLLGVLPPVFVVSNSSQTPWLKHLLDLILEESFHPTSASDEIVDRLSELLFTYALRDYFIHNPQEPGILALYGHPKLSKVIQAIHQQPNYPWTLEALASSANQSRSTFAETFKRACGWTAMQYVTWWRMQLAWSKLRSGESVAEVSEAVGYNSEASFSRAFSKEFSVSAGKVRRHQD